MADYNINAVTRRVVFTGSAGLGPYAFTFEILDEDDLAVYFNATKLTKTTDYTVTINANGTGSITIVTGGSVPSTPTASDTIIILGARDIERVTDFVTAGDLLASSLNEQLDALTIFDQQLAEENARTLRAPVYDPALVEDGGTLDMTLPAKAARAGKYLQFNSTTGNPEAGPDSTDVTTLADIATDIATLADIEDGTDATDAIQTVAGISSNVTTVAGIAANVSTVAGNTSNINAVAADATDIGTVATNIASVNTVAGNISEVVAVANDLNEAVSEVETVANDLNEAVSEIETVAASISNVDAVGTNIANVNTVAGIDSNVTTVAGISGDVTTVSGIAGNVTTVGGISANVTTVAGISSNVTTVAGINSDVTAVAADATDIGTVSTNIANVNTVAGSIANVNTVATNIVDVNSFANQYRIAATAPATSLDEGDLYFDTTQDQMFVYTGSAWVAVSPDLVADTTPQLGGDLDLNSNDITGTGNVNITGTLTADGLTVDGVAQINAANPNLVFFETDTTNLNAIVRSNGGQFKIQSATDVLASTDRVLLDHATGDISFYDNTGTTQGFYWDASEVRLGLGTTSPARNLHLYAENSDASVRFQNTANSKVWEINPSIPGVANSGISIVNVTDNTVPLHIDNSGKVAIGTASTAAGQLTIQSSGNQQLVVTDDGSEKFSMKVSGNDMTLEAGSGGSNSTNLIFKTASSGTESEAARIDSSRNLLVGKTASGVANTGAELQSSGFTSITRDGGAPLQLNRKTSDGDLFVAKKDGTTVGSIGAKGGDLIIGTGDVGIRFNDAGDALRPTDQSTGSGRDNAIDIGDSGNRFKDLYLSGGAYLGGTAAANQLDDYEEGTYTPAFSSTGATFSYSVQEGSYVKIGELVCCWFAIVLSASPSGTTSNVVTFNVPFATKAVDGNLYSGGHIGHYFNINLGSGTSLAYQLPSASATQVELKEVGDNIGENGIAASELNTTAVIRGSVMYRAAS